MLWVVGQFDLEAFTLSIFERTSAAEQRLELSPRRGFASLGLGHTNSLRAAERRQNRAKPIAECAKQSGLFVINLIVR